MDGRGRWIRRELEQIAGRKGNVSDLLFELGFYDEKAEIRFRALVRKGRTAQEAINFMRRTTTSDRVKRYVQRYREVECPALADRLGLSPEVALYHLNKLMLSGDIECEARGKTYKYRPKHQITKVQESILTLIDRLDNPDRNEIAVITKLSIRAVKFHLKNLHDAGLVDRFKDGLAYRYSVKR